MAENIFGNKGEKVPGSGSANTATAQMTKEHKTAEGANAKFEEFDETFMQGKNISGEKLALLHDLMLNVYIELGRTQMKVKHILELERGYVIELDKLASEPVEIYANNKKIAEGEVVVIDKHFGIRITNLLESSKRLEAI